MVDSLAIDRGAYFSDLLENYGTQADLNLNRELLDTITDKLRQIDLCPQLVIGNIVANTFGAEEAARGM